MIIILLYLAASLYFGRRNPLFYLLLPYALQQGQTAFIDQSIQIGGMYPFSVSGTVFIDVLLVIVVLLTIFLIRARIPSVRFVGSQLIIIFASYIALLTGYSLLLHADPREVLLTARNFFYVPLSFFLWTSIFHAVTRSQYEQFLRFFIYITPILAVLYILNSSGLVPLFDPMIMYQEVEGASGTFYRDFSTIPTQLVPVFVISVLSFVVPTMRLPRWLLVANCIILPVAILFTFTRSVLVVASATLLVSLFIITVFSRVSVVRTVGMSLVILALFFVPAFLVSKAVFPDAVAYFGERLNSLAQEGTQEGNVDIRREYLQKAIEITQVNHELTGIGMNRSQYEKLDEVGAWAADSTLPYLLYHTGWIGICLFYGIMLFFVLDSLLWYRRTNDWLVAFLSASMFTTTIASLIMGGGHMTGSVWTFASLALYTTIRMNLWKKDAAEIHL